MAPHLAIHPDFGKPRRRESTIVSKSSIWLLFDA
jgi:hypothetical protein